MSPPGPDDAVGATVDIVPVAEHHAQGFRACLHVVARERRYLAHIEAPPLEQVEALVRESVANDAAQFMAVDGGRVVGWADVLPSWAHAVAHVGSLGMGVLPAYRGRCMGRRLLGACIAKAWARGITRIELEVRVGNERAIGLYRSLGFEQEAVNRRAMRFDGGYHDALLMSLLKDAGRRCTDSAPGTPLVPNRSRAPHAAGPAERVPARFRRKSS